jgi:AcrR family transcriptional regulator
MSFIFERLSIPLAFSSLSRHDCAMVSIDTTLYESAKSSANKPRGRVAVRQERNREALVLAGYKVMSKKGIDAATMQEIAEFADVGAGTVYSYFKNKDELAIAVLERVMYNLALRIEAVTNDFKDPAQVYAFGLRCVIEAATGDRRWKQLLHRSEVIANAMFNCMGPFAIRDMEKATKAGRFKIADARLNFKLASFAIVGASRAITQGVLTASAIDETVIRLLCMNGIGEAEAIELAHRPCPQLPPENSVPEHKLK